MLSALKKSCQECMFLFSNQRFHFGHHVYSFCHTFPTVHFMKRSNLLHTCHTQSRNSMKVGECISDFEATESLKGP